MTSFYRNPKALGDAMHRIFTTMIAPLRALVKKLRQSGCAKARITITLKPNSFVQCRTKVNNKRNDFKLTKSE